MNSKSTIWQWNVKHTESSKDERYEYCASSALGSANWGTSLYIFVYIINATNFSLIWGLWKEPIKKKFGTWNESENKEQTDDDTSMNNGKKVTNHTEHDGSQ